MRRFYDLDWRVILRRSDLDFNYKGESNSSKGKHMCKGPVAETKDQYSGNSGKKEIVVK